MASKDGSIPGFKKSEVNAASEEDLSSAQGAPVPDAAANVSPPPTASASTPPPSSSSVVEEPEYTPETWAINMVKLVRNPPKSITEKGGLMLDSEDSLSTPEHLSYPPSDLYPPSTYKKKGRPKGVSETKTVAKKHARQDYFSSASTVSEISISSDSSSASSEDESQGESPVSKRARMEPKNLVYSWDSLLLGKELGSVALNQHLTQLHGTLSQLTPLQTLQIVQSTRLETIVPPETSKLAQVSDANRLLCLAKDGKEDDKDGFKSCARVYEGMLKQDVSQNRRQIQQLSPSQLVGRLEHLEHAVASLQERETSTMATCQELKLISNVEICRQLGFRTPLEKYNSRRPPPPPQARPPPVQQQLHGPAPPSVQLAVARPVVGTSAPPPVGQQQGLAGTQPRNQPSQNAPATSMRPRPPHLSSLTPPTSKQPSNSTQRDSTARKEPVIKGTTQSSECLDGKIAALKETESGSARYKYELGVEIAEI